MKKNRVWLWITLLIVIVSFIWAGKMYKKVKGVMIDEPAPSSQTSLFPSPEDTKYRMDLKLDPISLELSGYSIITSKNTSGTQLKELWFTTYPNVMSDWNSTPAPSSAYYAGFDPGWLKISSVLVNKSPASCTSAGISSRIDLSTAVKMGELLTIEMQWSAKIPRAAYRYGSKDGVILLGHFYPLLNVKDYRGWHISSNTQFGDPFYTQCADYVVRLRVPEAYQIATSGEIASIEAEDNGWQSMIITANRVRDFALAAVLNYQTLAVSVDGVKVIGFFNGKNQILAREVLGRAAAALKYYSCTYGSYSHPQLVLVQGPMKGFQGMEYSGMIFLSEDIFAPEYGEQRRAFLVAHEVAHQWWYDMVGNNQLEEPWLDEGLANWSARQYLKMVEYRSHQNQSKTSDVNLNQGLEDMASKSYYLETAYQGGEAFWNQLEDELGEDKVLKILRCYLARYKFRTATTVDLREIISEESRTPLQSFYERWF